MRLRNTKFGLIGISLTVLLPFLFGCGPQSPLYVLEIHIIDTADSSEITADVLNEVKRISESRAKNLAKVLREQSQDLNVVRVRSEDEGEGRVVVEVRASEIESVLHLQRVLGLSGGHLSVRLEASEEVKARLKYPNTEPGLEWIAITDDMAERSGYWNDGGNGHVLLQTDEIFSNKGVDKAAMGLHNQSGEPVVNIRLTATAAEALHAATKENTGKVLTVVFDGELITYATIQSPLPGGSFQLSGLSLPEAVNIAGMMMADPLPVEVEVTLTQSPAE